MTIEEHTRFALERPAAAPAGDTAVAGEDFFSVLKEKTGAAVSEEVAANKSFVDDLFRMGDVARHTVSVATQALQKEVQKLTGAP